jgi:(2R)-sulfolactate sulfo-lyase subunit alpha
MSEPSAVILLHPEDTVLVLRRSLQPGESVIFDNQQVTVTESIEVGHKLARFDLKAGSRILKYGAPIGSLTQDVPRGGHVHLHNMKSDYIPSHTRKASGNASA